jgi:hypothetical protein
LFATYMLVAHILKNNNLNRKGESITIDSEVNDIKSSEQLKGKLATT